MGDAHILKERLEIAKALSGISLYDYPFNARELPEFCGLVLNSSLGDRCKEFHNDLFKSASSSGAIEFKRCPWGLLCFAADMGGLQIGGGHVRDGELDLSSIKIGELSKIALDEFYRKLKHLSEPRLREIAGGLARLLENGTIESPASKIAQLTCFKKSLQEVIEQLVLWIKEWCECDGVLIFYRESRGRTSCSQAGIESFDIDSVLELVKERGSISEHLDRNGEAIFLGAADLSGYRLESSVSRPRSGLLIPFPPVGKSDISGFVLFLWSKEADFSSLDLESKVNLASEVFLGLRSARFKEEMVRRLTEKKRRQEQLRWSFAQTGTALASALDLKELLRLILKLSVQLMRADGGFICLVEGNALSSVYRCGLREESIEAGSLKTVLLFPFMRHNRVKAILKLISFSRKFFRSEEVKLLEHFAAQAAMAIENAQIFEWEQQKAREATTLYQAARTIEEGQDLDEVLELSADVLARVAEVDRCIIFLQDYYRGYLKAAATVGLSPEQKEFFSAYRIYLSQLSNEVQKTLFRGSPLVYDSIASDKVLYKLCSLMPSASCLIVPLLAKDRLLGIIFLDDSTGVHRFNASMVRRVMTLSLQVANAIHRASLINQLQENLGPLKALYQVSTAITGTLSLSKVIRLIVERAVELLERSACACLVLDEIGESFRLETSSGLPDKMLDPALQAKIAKPAVEKKRAYYRYLDSCNGYDENPELYSVLKEAGFGGWLSVPLINKKKMVGVLNCFVEPGIKFREQEIRLLKGFANQAAVAVENARLHGMIRFKMGELGTLFEVSKAITSTLCLDRVLQEIVSHVSDILRADACSLMLLESEHLVMRAAEGLDLRNYSRPIPLDEGLAGVAVKTCQPAVFIDDERSLDTFPDSVRREGLRTILSVPVESRGKVIGLINAYYREPTNPSPTQLSLLKALGNQAAVAIENARLYAEKERVTELLRNVLIPREKLEFPGLTVGHRFIPSMDLSGDYYDLIPLDDKRCGLVIADVSGKGPDAAIQTVRAKHVIKSYATAGYSPSEILRMLNKQVGADQLGESRQVTVFYAEADLESRTLRYASAGHEIPIFWVDNGEPVELKADGIIIGAVDDADFEEPCRELPRGSWLLLYTDGVTEARSPSGEFFGLHRILEIVSEHKGNSAQRLVNKIYMRVRKFTREKILDDFSVMAVRFN